MELSRFSDSWKSENQEIRKSEMELSRFSEIRKSENQEIRISEI